nr:hypothetical protein DGKKSRWO_DGKKSRWO_CDS_0080 [uncultured phage]CAI9752252.1 hypothetical protein CVNMHQAP_CVNMHQAP_CDS_0080 [uncultured phage]
MAGSHYFEDELCYNCKYLGFDTCGDGYCGNRQRRYQADTVGNNLVIDDSGCSVTDCNFFKRKEDNV